MTENANQELFDALVRHQIYLLRLSARVRNDIYSLLNETEKDLVEQINNRLKNSSGGLSSPAEVRRLDTLLRIVRNTRLKAWDEITESWVLEMQEVAKQEPVFLSNAIQTVVPVVLTTNFPTADKLKSIVKSSPFQGRVLKKWAETIKQEDIRRIENAIRVGMVQGETTKEIARRVVGSARLRGVDGVTEITRTQADAITRTAINHIANEARQEFYKENKDLFEEELFVATLDSRTTAVCRANDGKRFPIGKGPRPPLHFRCRSLRVPSLLPEVLGNRPAKPITEKMLLREFSKRENLQKQIESRKEIPHGLKTKYDTFSRKRIREMTGQVSGNLTYQEWLRKQSLEFQEDVLGKTKARLFRQGNLALDKFIDQNGKELTLAQLAKKEKAAFIAAGLRFND